MSQQEAIANQIRQLQEVIDQGTKSLEENGSDIIERYTSAYPDDYQPRHMKINDTLRGNHAVTQLDITGPLNLDSLILQFKVVVNANTLVFDQAYKQIPNVKVLNQPNNGSGNDTNAGKSGHLIQDNLFSRFFWNEGNTLTTPQMDKTAFVVFVMDYVFRRISVSIDNRQIITLPSINSSVLPYQIYTTLYNIIYGHGYAMTDSTSEACKHSITDEITNFFRFSTDVNKKCINQHPLIGNPTDIITCSFEIGKLLKMHGLNSRWLTGCSEMTFELDFHESSQLPYNTIIASPNSGKHFDGNGSFTVEIQPKLEYHYLIISSDKEDLNTKMLLVMNSLAPLYYRRPSMLTHYDSSDSIPYTQQFSFSKIAVSGRPRYCIITACKPSITAPTTSDMSGFQTYFQQSFTKLDKSLINVTFQYSAKFSDCYLDIDFSSGGSGHVRQFYKNYRDLVKLFCKKEEPKYMCYDEFLNRYPMMVFKFDDSMSGWIDEITTNTAVRQVTVNLNTIAINPTEKDTLYKDSRFIMTLITDEFLMRSYGQRNLPYSIVETIELPVKTRGQKPLVPGMTPASQRPGQIANVVGLI